MSTQSDSTPLPQGWVPRVVNASLALFLLAFEVPVLIHVGGLPLAVQLMLVGVSVPVVLVAGLCLASAIRPGVLGRFVRSRRAR